MTGSEPGAVERFRIVLLIVNLVVVVPIVILLASNTHRVDLEWLGWSIRVPLYVVLLTTFVAGAILDEIIGIVWRVRRRRSEALKTELQSFRNGAQGRSIDGE